MSQKTFPLETIFRGADVTVSFHAGPPAVVRVRQMPARRLLDVMSIIEKEAELIELCCVNVPGSDPLPEGWVDALTDESNAVLVEKARELNFSRGSAQLERNAALQKQLKALETRVESTLSSSPTVR